MNPGSIAFVAGLLLSISSLTTAATGRYRYVYVTPKAKSKCPLSAQPCYTLSQISDDPARYFASNTTVVLLPGTHNINSTTDTAIEDVSNIALVGGIVKVSRIQCIGAGEFGFAFSNVKNLTISNIWLSDCSAPLLWDEIVWQISSANLHSEWLPQVNDIIYNKIPAALYLIQVSYVKISKLKISNSDGAGLLGINVLGNTSITNSSFTRNKVNSYFQFMDAERYPVHTVLQLQDTDFAWGKTSDLHHAAGLTIVMAQSTYSILVKIINVAMYGNLGASGPYGNMLIRFDECNNYQIEIVIQGLNCSRPIDPGISYLDDTEYSERGMDLEGDLDLTESNCRYFQHPIQISNSHFSHNKVALSIWRIRGKLVIFENVTIFQNSKEEAVLDSFSVSQSNVSLKNTNFSHNEIMADIKQSTITFQDNTFNNTGEWGALYAESSNVTFQGNATFIKNKGIIGGAIYLKNSTLTTEGSIYFLENEGYNGGAIAFHSGSILKLGAHGKIQFTGNHAQHQGGAIYVYNPIDPSGVYLFRSQGVFLFPQITCFYQARNKEIIAPIVLENNTANDAGSAVFGGWVDICDGKWLYEYLLLFDTMFKISKNSTDLSQISSTPIIVCICFNYTPNCNYTNVHISAYPGQTFYISAVAVGQRLGIVPTIIRSAIFPTQSTIQPTLDTLQYSQNVEKVCTNLSYTVRSPRREEMIILSVDESVHQNNIRNQKYEAFSQSILPDIFIHLHLKLCPKGFIFDNNSCVCDLMLQKHAISCDINSQRIHRQPSFWIYSVDTEEAPSGSPMRGVLVHKHCPLDYCKSYSLNLSLENPDEQCAFHRSQILCGSCQHNLSNVLGSSNCKQCSNLWLILFIPVFVLAGITLVIFLMSLNFTVSIGTVNGLIFYANIVRANQAIFFPHSTNNSFLSWFIAWINLDLGIETCFYSGFDSYAKTWLQFVFPMYIWLVVILIIVSSYYSILASKLAGRNAVQVLATLFLLSYAKLLRVTITALSSTTLEYPDGSIRRVWLYDGNVDYLKGKHIPLFMAALLVILVLSLPYTAVLLFIQCLQLKAKYRVLFWIGKFKPLFDAYTGPYQDKHRYWTGFLLLVRAILFLIFSVNIFGDPAINLLTIVATVLFLFIKLAVSKGVYKIQYINILEYTFIFNLGTLSAASLYTRLTNGNQSALTYTSVSIAFVTFCGITVYHATIRITSSQERCQYLIRNITELKRKLLRARQPQQSHEEEEQTNLVDLPVSQQVPVTYIHLREPLMEYCDS